MQIRRAAAVSLGLLVLVTVASVLFTVFREQELQRRIVFFPDPRSGLPVMETRFLPGSGDETLHMRDLLQAVLAGPQDLTLSRIVPRDARIRQFYLEKGHAWLIFDQAVLAPDERCHLEGRERFAWINRTLRYNYPFLAGVSIVIDGRTAAVF